MNAKVSPFTEVPSKMPTVQLNENDTVHENDYATILPIDTRNKKELIGSPAIPCIPSYGNNDNAPNAIKLTDANKKLENGSPNTTSNPHGSNNVITSNNDWNSNGNGVNTFVSAISGGFSHLFMKKVWHKQPIELEDGVSVATTVTESVVVRSAQQIATASVTSSGNSAVLAGAVVVTCGTCLASSIIKRRVISSENAHATDSDDTKKSGMRNSRIGHTLLDVAPPTMQVLASGSPYAPVVGTVSALSHVGIETSRSTYHYVTQTKDSYGKTVDSLKLTENVSAAVAGTASSVGAGLAVSSGLGVLGTVSSEALVASQVGTLTYYASAAGFALSHGLTGAVVAVALPAVSSVVVATVVVSGVVGGFQWYRRHSQHEARAELTRLLKEYDLPPLLSLKTAADGAEAVEALKAVETLKERYCEVVMKAHPDKETKLLYFRKLQTDFAAMHELYMQIASHSSSSSSAAVSAAAGGSDVDIDAADEALQATFVHIARHIEETIDKVSEGMFLDFPTFA